MEGAEKMLTMDSLNVRLALVTHNYELTLGFQEFGRHQLESELASALSEIKAIQDKKNDIRGLPLIVCVPVL
jgi:hypothetical protein